MTEVILNLKDRNPGDDWRADFDSIVEAWGDTAAPARDPVENLAWKADKTSVGYLLGKLGASLHQRSSYVGYAEMADGKMAPLLIEPYFIGEDQDDGWRISLQDVERVDETGPYRSVTHFVTDAVSSLDQDPDELPEPEQTWGGSELRIRPENDEYPAAGSVTSQFAYDMDTGKLKTDTHVPTDDALDALTQGPGSVQAEMALKRLLGSVTPMFWARVINDNIETTIQ